MMSAKNKNVNYWLQSAAHDFVVAKNLLKNKHYDWALFIGHLVLEKTLKAHFAKKFDEFPPKSHDLVRLGMLIRIDFDNETLDFLDGVNSFNISTRYPDEKLRFYNMCTPQFTFDTFKKIEEIYEWLLQQI